MTQPKPTCKAAECARPSRRSSGYCEKHHYRWEKYGDPKKVKLAVSPQERFGRLVVLEVAGRRGDQRTFLCLCDCGNEKVLAGADLKSQTGTRSCGCLRRERASEKGARGGRHYLTGTRAHNSWLAMIGRCTNPNASNWHLYGGRGITVCDRWRNSFEDFLADMGARPTGTTLDRIDVNGKYEPGNCRWATIRVQNSNRRRHHKLNDVDVEQILKAKQDRIRQQDVADQYGVAKSTISLIWRRGR